MKAGLILIVSFLLVGCGNLVKNGSMVEAQKALNSREYAEALENIDIAESFGELSSDEAAKLHYLRAQALEGLGRLGEAKASYRYVAERHGNSAYAEQALQKLHDLRE